MTTIHVWSEAKYSKAPHLTKETGALTIQRALNLAAPGDMVLVHGDAPPYRENVVVPPGGIALCGTKMPVIHGGNTDRCVKFPDGEKALTTLSGFEITGGYTEYSGAGVFVRDSAALIERNCIHGNTAVGQKGDGTTSGFGGGICVQYTRRATYERAAYVIANRIESNQATHGAGVALLGVTTPMADAPTQPVVLVRNNVIGPFNRARGTLIDNDPKRFVYGGGLAIFQLPVLVDHNEIHQNFAQDAVHKDGGKGKLGESNGGGVCVFNANQNDFLTQSTPASFNIILANEWEFASGQVNLRWNHIHNNHSDYKGGGVAGLWGAQLRYEGNRIESNEASFNGGGVYSTTRGRHVFANDNVIRDNSAPGIEGEGQGGGIHGSCRSIISFSGHNYVVHNWATRRGGGISLENSDLEATAQLEVQDNRAGTIGGGICLYTASEGAFIPCYDDGKLIISSAIFLRNHADEEGGAIAVWKTYESSAAKPLRISKTWFIDNDSKTQFMGTWVRRDVKGSELSIEACEFSRHGPKVSPPSDPAAPANNQAVALAVRDEAANFTSIQSSLFDANGVDISLDRTEANVGGCVFRGTAMTQIRVRADTLGVQIANCDFDGSNFTPVGIERVQTNSNQVVFAQKNNFHEHTGWAITTGAADPVSAPFNWWGNAKGPTLPGGPKLGDAVTAGVISIAPPPPPSNELSLSQPPSPGVQGTSWSDLSAADAINCDAAKGKPSKHENPPMITPPSIPDVEPPSHPPIHEPPQYPVPPGTQERERSGFKSTLRMLDGSDRTAYVSEGGDAILLDSSRAPTGLLTREGELIASPHVAAAAGEPTSASHVRRNAVIAIVLILLVGLLWFGGQLAGELLPSGGETPLQPNAPSAPQTPTHPPAPTG